MGHPVRHLYTMQQHVNSRAVVSSGLLGCNLPQRLLDPLLLKWQSLNGVVSIGISRSREDSRVLKNFHLKPNTKIGDGEIVDRVSHLAVRIDETTHNFANSSSFTLGYFG